MAECASLAGCPFFNDKMVLMPFTSSLLKKQYCMGNNAQCARFMVAGRLGKEKVPIDLYPEDVIRALEILGETENT